MANLSALLEKEASAEIEAILAEARERASEIVEAAKTEAESLVTQQERLAKSQYEAALVRARSSAQLEASSLRLRTQHEAVEKVMTTARGKLGELSRESARYEAVLGGLLAEALEGLGKDRVEAVIVNPADRTLAETLAGRHGLAGKVETSEGVQGGVRLRALGGNVTLENTLQGRLESLRDELASDISRTLFAKDGG